MALAAAGQGSVQAPEPVAGRRFRQSPWPAWYADAQSHLKPLVVLVNAIVTVVSVFAAFLTVYAIVADQVDNGFDPLSQWGAIAGIAVAAAILSFADARDGVLRLRMAAVVLANVLGIAYLLNFVAG